MKLIAKEDGVSMMLNKRITIGNIYYAKYQIYQGPYYYIKDDIGYDWYPVNCFMKVSELRDDKLDIILG